MSKQLEQEVEALIQEHAAIGYQFKDGHIDGDTLRIWARGAAHVIVHHLMRILPVMGIRLRKDGEHTVVDVEIDGSWIEVIRERTDGEFCHIVEPGGIYSCYRKTG